MQSCGLDRSPFTVHRSPFTVHCSLFTVYRLPFTVYRLPFTVYCSLFTVYPIFCYHCTKMWILLGIFSATFLGFHEIFKKAGLDHNAVLPVLGFSSAAGAVVFVPFLVFSRLCPALTDFWGIYVPVTRVNGHLFFLLKSPTSCIV